MNDILRFGLACVFVIRRSFLFFFSLLVKYIILFLFLRGSNPETLRYAIWLGIIRVFERTFRHFGNFSDRADLVKIDRDDVCN